MSSRPPKSLKTFKATLILQCFAIVKLFIHANIVLCRPWNPLEMIFVAFFLISDVVFVMIVFSGNAKCLVLPHNINAINILFHFFMLLLLFVAKQNGLSYEGMQKDFEHGHFYFTEALDSQFAYITFFVTIIIVLFIEHELIYNVRMLKDPKFKKQQEELTFCGIKVHRNTAAEIV